MTRQRRRVLRACLTAGVLLAGGLALLPAKAATAPRVVMSGAAPVNGVRLVDVRGGQRELTGGPESLDRLLRSADFSAGPTVVLDVARQALAQRGGPQQPDLDPTTSIGGEAETDTVAAGSVAVAHSTWSWSFPVGDLDGDGGQDLIVRSYVDDAVVTEALSGADAHRLWRLDAGIADDSLVVPGGDIDGDGVGDFALQSMVGIGRAGGSCDYDGCEWSSRWEFVQKHVVLSGATGAVRFSTEEPGWVEMGAGDSDRGNIVRRTHASWSYVRGENVWSGPDIGVPGQSLPGTVVNRIDLDDIYEGDEVRTAQVMTLSSSNAALHSVTEAEVVDGAGTAIASMRSEGPHVSSLSWTGQLTGDATPDLLWAGSGRTPTSHQCREIDALVTDFERCRDEREPTVRWMHLVALDGATLDEAWSAELESPGWLWSGSDLTGDGAGEIRIVDYWGDSTRMVSGADGSVLWQAPGFPLGDLGDLGGAPQADVVLAEFGGSWSEGVQELSLHRVEGTTGAALSTTDHAINVEDANMVMLWASPVPNAGGGASGDMVVSTGTAWVDSDAQTVADQSSAVVVEDGATGATIGARELNAFAGVYGITDVTGDGLADGISWRYDFAWIDDEWGTYLGVTHVDEAVVQLAPLAEHSLLPADRYLISTMDVDGSGPDEMLFGRWLQLPDGGSSTELSLLSAVDGTTRWTWSYTP